VVRRRAEPALEGAPSGGHVIRHRLADRLFHWITAACVLTLLGTAFVPILGVEFPWVTAHWLTGLVLIAAVLFHTLRALLFQRLRSIWIGRRDVSDLFALARFNLRLGGPPTSKPGKYSFAQKLIHHFFTVVILTAAATGALMLTKIDSPWWQRNPYWLGAGTWGVVYVLHDLAALLLITMVMTHVYFALRPEKWPFTRAMIVGWITREEYGANHDSSRWQLNE
jgi:formate dehydrogenase subunit gamma